MVRLERITDPEAIDPATIEALASRGIRPVLQFSKPGVSDRVLDDVNSLCERLGDRLDVRFYGFYFAAFDCRALQRLPAVSSLLIDCLEDASHIEELTKLTRLRRLSLGIDRLGANDILAASNLDGLLELSIGPTQASKLDLSHVGRMKSLVALGVAGQETSIESIAHCARLRELSLTSIGRRVDLGFVNQLGTLRLLRILLGGRDDIDEIRHRHLTSLELVRIRGLRQLRPEHFPSLKELSVEDQLKLLGLRFKAGCGLTKLRVVNCKSFADLGGLSKLDDLVALRVSRTALDLEALVAAGLPDRLRICALYAGRRQQDARLRKRLDELGYSGR
jgi:hypothetical protein